MEIIDSTSSNYQDLLDGIRRLVNNAYDTDNLSDKVIANDTFLGRFNREVAISVPNWETLDSNHFALLQNAIQLKTAAQLLWAEGRLKREDVEQEQSEYLSASIEAIIEDYRKQADDIIAPIQTEVTLIASLFKPVFKVINTTKRY